MKSNRLLIHLFLLTALFAAPHVRGAAYIKLGDIKGESTHANHLDWSDALSVEMKLHREFDEATGRLVGPPTVDSFCIRKEIDKASPLLFRALVQGEQSENLEIDFTRPVGTGGATETYLKYKLSNVIVSSFQINADGESGWKGEEVLCVRFESITVTYTPFTTDGTPMTPVEVTYSFTPEV